MNRTSSVIATAPRLPLYGRAHYYFGLAFLFTVGGFWPSFFTRLESTDVAHLIHGVSATLWMAIPIAQAWLMSRRQLEWHRWLGRLALPLVPIVVVSGLHMVQVMILADPGIAQPLRTKFVFLDTGAILLFPILVGLALKNLYQRNITAHAQYMAATVIVVLEPGLERFLVLWAPGVNDFTVGLNIALVAMELIAATLIYVEWKAGRGTPRPYVIVLAFFVLVHLLLEPVSHSTAFRGMATWLATF